MDIKKIIFRNIIVFLFLFILVGCCPPWDSDCDDDPTDTIPPVITLNGDSNVTIYQGATYQEEGATAEDDTDDNVEVTISGSVDTSEIGVYTITYRAVDSAGNESIKRRVVRVIKVPDTTPPVIMLNGDSNVTIYQGATYQEEGAIAEDDTDDNVEVTISGSVDTSEIGVYTITYRAVDSAGNESIKRRVVRVIKVPDTTPPVIDSNVTIYQGATEGNTSEDDTDDVVRVIKVPDTTPPIITLNGNSRIVVDLNSTYRDAGATAMDNRDGNITSNIVVVNPVDTTTVGRYIITYDVNDSSGNQADRVIRTVDVIERVPPTIELLNLENKAIVEDITTPLKFRVKDNIGIDSIELYLNDINRTLDINIDGENVTLISTENNPLPIGELNIKVIAKDTSGNVATKIFTLYMQPQTIHSINIEAYPKTAYAPATIKFIARVNISKAIEKYYWDLDGDGNFEIYETVANTHTYNYRTPNDYNITLKTVDTDGVETNSSIIVEIKNRPPIITANVVPSNGEVPLDVHFQINATDNEGIKLYKVDFDGDGTYDSNSTGSYISHTYTEIGDYNAKIRVTDNLGVSNELSVPTTTVIAKPIGSPSVTAIAYGTSGNEPLTVSFSIRTNLPDNQHITKYQWDFDNDGVWDYESVSTASTSHIYNQAGVFFAKVKIITDSNKTAEDFIQIDVKENLSLQRDVDTIDTFLNEKVIIKTDLSGTNDISLIIEKNPYELIKTLVPWTTRTAGNYEDSWDGRDDNNRTVTEDIYHAVLLYKINGVVKRLDLRDNSGGNRYTITNRSRIPSSFQPFGNNPLKINFTIDKASEVTAFIGRYNSNVRLKTFTNRKPFAKGTHTIIWNGTNADGVLAHPPVGDSFLFGAFGYTLANNAIYVKSRATVSNVDATPEIYVPTVPANNPNSISKITFDLSLDSDVDMVISSVDTGQTLFYKRFSSLSQGTNTLTWNGKDNKNRYVPTGNYRIGIRAVDSSGYNSITIYTLQRVFY